MAAPYHTDFQQGKSLLHGTKNQRLAHTYLPEEVWASEGWRTVCGAALTCARLPARPHARPPARRPASAGWGGAGLGGVGRGGAGLGLKNKSHEQTGTAMYRGTFHPKAHQIQSVPQKTGHTHKKVPQCTAVHPTPPHKTWVVSNR